MATKKRRIKRPNVQYVYANIVNISKASEANTAMFQLAAERVKATDLNNEKGDDVPQPTWKDVDVLLHGQIDLLRLLGEAYMWLEDPAVAHVVELKKSIDKMERKIEDLREELNSHVSCYSHNRNDSCY